MDHPNPTISMRIHNAKRNFLAFIRNFCYRAPISEPSPVFGMGATRQATANKLASAAFAVALAAAVPLQACAQENQVASNDTQTECVTPSAPLAPPEALALSRECDGVIYYGASISERAAETTARSIREHEGYNVISVAGYPSADGVVALVSGRPVGGRQSESDLYQGRVGSAAVRAIRTSLTAASLSTATQVSYDN